MEDLAIRTVIISLIGAIALSACGGEPAAPAANEPAPEPAAAPETPPTPAIQDTTGGRIGTMNLNCAGETFRVAFLDTHAAIVSADGASTVELPILPEGPTSEPGVTVYSDGMQQFAKSGGGDTPTVIRYAKARMAWQDCAIAVN
jgi:hypothetical protein